MIKGVGIDVVEIERIARAMRNPRFVERILTVRERRFGAGPEFVAGRWAAKEAVAKAVGCHLSWHDVEVLVGDSGAPVVTPLEGGWRIHISITHAMGFAAAVAVWEEA